MGSERGVKREGRGRPQKERTGKETKRKNERQDSNKPCSLAAKRGVKERQKERNGN